MDIAKYKTVKRWLNGVRTDKSGSDYTEARYLEVIEDFCGWAEKTPDQLIEERKTDLESKDEAIKRKAEERLREYCIMLEKERGWKRSTAVLYHSAVKSFYKYNYYPLYLPSPRRPATRGLQPHSPEEIRELLTFADERNSFIILGLAESGMSREDFVTLTYGHVKKDYEAGKRFIRMNVVRQKEQVGYDAFLGTNAASALKTYLEYRKREGEMMKDDTPLVVTQRGETKALAPEALSQIFVTLGRKAGFKSSPHRLRKFFESYMGLSAPSLLVKYWMGHSLGVERSYFIPLIEEQRKEYTKGYEKIDVYGESVSEEKMRRETWKTLRDEGAFDEILKPEAEKRGVSVEFLKKQMFQAGKRPEKPEHAEKAEENEADCQKIVTEEELADYLAGGWHPVMTLPSGKIVVSNE